MTFSGDAGSAYKGCGVRRLVVLHFVKDGVDSIAGTDITEYRIGSVPGGGESNWSIDAVEPTPPFNRYAVVTKKVKRRYICKRAVSPLAPGG